MIEVYKFDREPDFLSGEVILFDKPKDWSSFDVVNKIRYLISDFLKIKKIKVGHAGTLDPLATGLLILCTGKATKLIEELQEEEKIYNAIFQLGATTPSFDLETEIDQTFDYSHITENQIVETLNSFLGESMQMPPVYSAIKINGKRAYEIKRKGKEPKLVHKPINISEIKINSIDLPFIDLTITCSKGTYIRSIANDFGKKLDNGAFLYYLRRLKSGQFDVKNAVEIEFFENFLKKMKQN